MYKVVTEGKKEYIEYIDNVEFESKDYKVTYIEGYNNTKGNILNQNDDTKKDLFLYNLIHSLKILDILTPEEKVKFLKGEKFIRKTTKVEYLVVEPPENIEEFMKQDDFINSYILGDESKVKYKQEGYNIIKE